MSWRPSDWKNPHWKRSNPNLGEPELIIGRIANAFEAGADAMLEALRELAKNPHMWLEFWQALDEKEGDK